MKDRFEPASYGTRNIFPVRGFSAVSPGFIAATSILLSRVSGSSGGYTMPFLPGTGMANGSGPFRHRRRCGFGSLFAVHLGLRRRHTGRTRIAGREIPCGKRCEDRFSHEGRRIGRCRSGGRPSAGHRSAALRGH
jgi:hypothetical protein